MPNRFSLKKPSGEKYHYPIIGQRIIKTTVAVFICLLISYLRGYQGTDIRSEACITAIICMQPYISDTRDYAISRFAGTMIGTGWGLLLLVILYSFPVLGENRMVLYALISVGVMMTLYSTVLVRRPDTSALAAAIFLWIVVTYPEIDTPYLRTFNHILDVLIGILSALLDGEGKELFVRAVGRASRPKRIVLPFVLLAARGWILPAKLVFRAYYALSKGAR